MKYAVKIDLSGLEQDVTRNVRRAVRQGLEEIGDKAVNKARLNHGYTDRTGNLTASIGFMLEGDGEVIEGGFESLPGKSAPEGKATGRSKAAGRLRGDGSTRLVVVAGMEYASYVEQGHTARNGRYIKPRAVLANAELLIREEVDKLQKDLNNIKLN